MIISNGVKEKIQKIIEGVIKEFSANEVGFLIEVPVDKKHGDYSTNVALILAKQIGKNPREVAEEIKEKIGGNKLFSKIEVAGPGFINFFVKDKVFIDQIKKIDKDFGKGKELKNKKIILDYTDPNPFKEFHIGHFVPNAVGESLSRIFEFEGAKVKRVCYQGDVGVHVAKAIWGKMQKPELKWGQAYAYGAKMYEESEDNKKQIQELNKTIYNRSDKKIIKLYNEGKADSLKHFDNIYKILGTHFDWLIFESETGPLGKKIVEKGLKGGIFEIGESGAVIFNGEKYGLHTRVFINSEGLPTYEAKDLGLAEIKYKKYKYDKSIVITGNEQNEYFKVMLAAMKQSLPKLAGKTEQIGHGMLRLPEGKMSSRTGSIITGESLIARIEEMVLEKINPVRNEASNGVKDRGFTKEEAKIVAEKVAVGAIKYSILKQSIGSDIIFNFEHSISFEGDSGPYLQYSYARAQSVLRKAKKEEVRPSLSAQGGPVSDWEKAMCNFSDAVEKANQKHQPNIIALYLIELASKFNSYYAENRIVDKKDDLSSYKVALTVGFSQIMKNGLWLLGIETLEKM